MILTMSRPYEEEEHHDISRPQRCTFEQAAPRFYR